MRKMFKTGLLLCALVAGKQVRAQVDPHYTQYYMYPQYLNPALTGAFDGSVRLTGIYRNQWGNISTPYSTPGISADFTTEKSMNFGVSVLNQSAGDGGYNYTTAYGSAAFTGVRFGANGSQRIVIGLQAGMVNRRFDRAKLTFGDQWNPITGYNPGTSMDAIPNTSSTVFDAGVGALYYDARPDRKANVYLGVAASHLTQPKDNFSGKDEAKLPIRYNVHGGIRFNISEQFSLVPNALYMRQGTASETMVGAYAQLKASEKTDLMLGVNYRISDAIAPYLGVTYNNMVIGCSYDVNVSDLGRMASGSNAFEVSITFIGKRKTNTKVDGNFVCPRL
jgi:type IX secretion system PorP/SprF family membrane protein